LHNDIIFIFLGEKPSNADVMRALADDWKQLSEDERMSYPAEGKKALSLNSVDNYQNNFMDAVTVFEKNRRKIWSNMKAQVVTSSEYQFNHSVTCLTRLTVPRHYFFM
jgi:hypothetical protein